MTREGELTRDIIAQTLTEALKPLDYVYAFYEAGAIAFNRIDKWSDIDLYIVVDDEKVNQAFQDVEKTLKKLSPIKQKLDIPQTGWPGVFQAFYKLENTNEYLIIDLAILTIGCPDKFLEPKIHGNTVFHFNKSDKIKPPLFDREAFVKKIQARLERLQAKFSMFNNFVQKEINRGNSLEALDLYHGLTLATLVEALRIKYSPFHYEFKMRYVHYELPSSTIEKLERLNFVKDLKDLQTKYREATEWFQKTILEINPKEIEKLVGM